jgi:cyclophilin family peptidyl-prolyl cis-trans isomerase
MKKILLSLISLVLIISACFAMGGNPPANNSGGNSMKSNNPMVVISTNKGTMVAELYPEKAPKTVENFLAYVDSGFYDGLIFHRVIPGFMVQGGGFQPGLIEKTPNGPIKNEAGNGLSNVRGTLAMARTSIVDSATAQFFINTVDNLFLDHKDDSARGYGYCVFGAVVDGMPSVDVISAVPTHTVGYFADVPVEDVVITSIKRK